MAPKEGPRRPPKRAAADVGSTFGAEREKEDQTEKDREIERLRLEIRRHRAEGIGSRPQSSSTAFPAVPAAEQRAAVRERAERSKVSLREFLRYDTPKFKGEEGEDLQGFLRETEKVIRRLPCTETRAIELVGMKMKETAWD